MQQIYRCQIIGERLHFTPLRHEMHLKRITSSEVMPKNEDGNSVLLIGISTFFLIKRNYLGTITGNIYALWPQNMELTEHLVFLDTALIGLNKSYIF